MFSEEEPHLPNQIAWWTDAHKHIHGLWTISKGQFWIGPKELNITERIISKWCLFQKSPNDAYSAWFYSHHQPTHKNRYSCLIFCFPQWANEEDLKLYFTFNRSSQQQPSTLAMTGAFLRDSWLWKRRVV